MTSHRLISADVATVVGRVNALERGRVVPVTDPCWLPRLPRGGAVLGWRDGWPRRDLGWQLWCCLELEASAHGTLAHLSSTPGPGRVGGASARVPELALRAWTAHRLSVLATDAEAWFRTNWAA